MTDLSKTDKEYLLKVLKRDLMYVEKKLTDNLKYDEITDLVLKDQVNDNKSYTATFTRTLLDTDVQLLKDHKTCLDLITHIKNGTINYINR